MVLEPGQTLSHYRLVEKIGEGGMGVVYRADDTKLGRQVALKVLPSELAENPERRMRFQREAQAAAAISHANIATIYEVNEAEGVTFIAMELVQGKPLRRLLEGRPLPILDAVRLATEIADGLAAAHRTGVIHRDLKPENVIVEPDGRAKILDFGLAKFLEEQVEPAASEIGKLATITSEMTRQGTVLGTAAYMSPEQARGLAVDARSDIFSFGILLYEMVTGRPPFRGSTSMDTLTAIIHEQPAPPVQVNPDVPAELSRILSKCLEKDPADRYQDSRDLAVDLRHLKRETNSQPLPLAEPGTAAPKVPSARRLPFSPALLWALGALLTASALVVAGWMLLPWSEESPEPIERRLTSIPTENYLIDARLSPDGKYLAYTDLMGLYLRVLETGESHPIALPDWLKVYSVEWFPDGTRLFANARDEEDRDGIWEISILGSPPRKLLEEKDSDAYLSPDGTRVAVLPDEKQHEIWLMGLHGEERRRLLSVDETDLIWQLSWSPGGQRIAYSRLYRGPDGRKTVSIDSVDLEDGRVTPILTDRGLIASSVYPLPFLWISDGRIVYSLWERPFSLDTCGLWEIEVDVRTGEPAGEPRPIAKWAGFSVDDLSATADARSLAFVRTEFQSDVYVGELEGDGTHLAAPRRLTLDDRNDWPQAWAPDGVTLLFTSKRIGMSDIFRQRVEEATAEPIVVSGANKWGIRPTPEGTSLLYWTREPSEEGPRPPLRLMRVALSGGPPRLVFEYEGKDRLGCECPRIPEGTCILSERGEETIVFLELDPVKGRGKEITTLHLEPTDRPDWALSPDGSRIAVVGLGLDGDRIRIFPVEGEEVTNFRAEEGYRLIRVAWAAGGDGLFAAWQGAPPREGLCHISLEGRMHILHDPATGAVDDPVPSPDGRHLAFTFVPNERNAWMLEGF